jgi:4-hydroxybenzoate polyprenyltransferase
MIREYLKLIRIKHWIKNVFVFVPVMFSKNLFTFEYILEVVYAFFAFSIASSIVYVFNDINDKAEDRFHPVKKYRPIASGKITVFKASIVLIVMIVSLSFSSFLFPTSFIIVLSLYIFINFMYTIWLKKVVIVDLLCIAAGFMLRVLGGAYVINVDVSNWLVLTTLFISLFLAVMKRRSELEAQSANNSTREVLAHYSIKFIDQISMVTTGGLIICYALYSVSERTVTYFKSDYLVYTIVFVVYGIFRYIYLVYNKQMGEDPTEIILKDKSTLINLILYVSTLVLIIYNF